MSSHDLGFIFYKDLITATFFLPTRETLMVCRQLLNGLRYREWAYGSKEISIEYFHLMLICEEEMKWVK